MRASQCSVDASRYRTVPCYANECVRNEAIFTWMPHTCTKIRIRRYLLVRAPYRRMVCNCCGCTLIRSSRNPLLSLSLFSLLCSLGISLFFNWSLNRLFADFVSTQFRLQTPVPSVVARMSNHETSTVIHFISLSLNLFLSSLLLSLASVICIVLSICCLLHIWIFSHLGLFRFCVFFLFLSSDYCLFLFLHIIFICRHRCSP